MLSFRIMDFYSICEAFTRLKMSPVFETVHFVLMSLNMRKDLLGSGELFLFINEDYTADQGVIILLVQTNNSMQAIDRMID